MEDSCHYRFLDEHYKRATQRISFIQWKLFQITTSCPSDSREVKEQKAKWKQTMGKPASCVMEAHASKRTIPLARFYRSLYDEQHGPFGHEELFRDELENHLPLNKTTVAGLRTFDGNFEEHFLYMYIRNNELPWGADDTSMDW
jgi:hypothetical protein